MISLGLPVAINKYPIYESDIEPLGLKLPSVKNCKLNLKVIKECYELLTNIKIRNKVVTHNLKVMEEKLHHRVIAEKLTPIMTDIFMYK